jgi:arginyl-tRNA synthetase
VRGFDLLINLWGPDHHGYINRVKSAIEALGYSRDILHVIIMQLVTLKSKEKMSKRKGTAILFSELREDVGKDAARYFYLTRRNSSILEFDIDLAKEASVNNPLFYAQYACARIESIFQKAQGQNFTGADISKLDEAAEINLVRAILQFSFAVEKAYYTYEPVFIVEYLKVLAASFHKFYETTRVIVDDQELTRARLNLIAATKTVLHCALNLLGITPVQKM